MFMKWLVRAALVVVLVFLAYLIIAPRTQAQELSPGGQLDTQIQELAAADATLDLGLTNTMAQLAIARDEATARADDLQAQLDAMVNLEPRLTAIENWIRSIPDLGAEPLGAPWRDDTFWDDRTGWRDTMIAPRGLLARLNAETSRLRSDFETRSASTWRPGAQGIR